MFEHVVCVKGKQRSEKLAEQKAVTRVKERCYPMMNSEVNEGSRMKKNE